MPGSRSETRRSRTCGCQWRWSLERKSNRIPPTLCRRAVAERLVRALVVVKVEVAIQRREQVQAAGEVAGVDEFVFQRAPQALDENVVQGAASPIHADRDAALLQRRQKIRRGELRALIGVPKSRVGQSGRPRRGPPNRSRSPSYWRVPN